MLAGICVNFATHFKALVHLSLLKIRSTDSTCGTTTCSFFYSVQCSVPLFTQFPVLLLIGCIESKQRLQMASVRFDILVINIDIIQLLLLLENLLRGTWKMITADSTYILGDYGIICAVVVVSSKKKKKHSRVTIEVKQ